MPSVSGSDSDTIRVLLATDNHIGYNERDPIRGDDSWKSFHEVLCIAKERDVDMVLLAGDLFHDNKPSRKAMYQCMRSLRMNCYGEKPCELEVLSDVSTNLQGAFNHVNYEDPDINVSIPVFSIHGNHDDPSGEGRLCALDLLQCAGLINYFGRAPENDNIVVSPILMQKGHTKLALYGLSNVRDERLFRTFRDGKVKFLRPGTQMSEWFNLMAVHQNHQAHTDTGYLPENFLQDFLDLVVWGHEHECIIEPRVNTEMGFSVVQPGSSVATALAHGESVSKHVGLLTINGKEFNIEPIRLKTVRPFMMKDITLSDDKSMRKVAKESENRAEVTRYLEAIVYEMIETANDDWLKVQQEEDSEIDISELKVPLPLIRLRVEHTALDGGNYEIENPQRFSNRFVGKVANTNDVVQFYRRKATATRSGKTNVDDDESKINALLEAYAKPEDIRVEELVKEFLTAQSLNILPQNGLGDAVSQFIDKSDLHAVETFVTETLRTQFKKVQEYNASTEEEIQEAMESAKKSLEQLFEKGDLKDKSKRKAKAKKVRAPDHDSDLDGHFDENDVDDDVEIASESAPESEPEPAPPSRTKAAPRGRARGGRAAPAATARKPAAKKKTTTNAPAKGKGKKAVVSSEEEEEEQDDDEDDEIVILDNEDSDLEMIDNDEDEVMPQRTTTRGGRKTTTPAKTSKSAPKKAAPAKKTAAPARQSTLNFSSQTPAATRSRKPPSDDDVDDEDDDFQPMENSTRQRR